MNYTNNNNTNFPLDPFYGHPNTINNASSYYLGSFHSHLQWLQSLNQTFASIGYLIQSVGMNAQNIIAIGNQLLVARTQCVSYVYNSGTIIYTFVMLFKYFNLHIIYIYLQIFIKI